MDGPLCLLFFQSQPAISTDTGLHWGLRTGEWITIAEIIVGPIAAVLTQLWFQKRRTARDQKLWVYGALISLRATWIAPDFVRALNFVDVVFYGNKLIRDKRTELLSHIKTKTGPSGS